jgi:hypothetical protein
MAKSAAKREFEAADRAYRKAWDLLDRIEHRLEAARSEERKRLHQLGDGTGADAAKRGAQLEKARADVAGSEALLTELSELIAAHSRAQAGTTVMDISREVAASIKEDAAEAPDPTPVRDRNPAARRNRHHRRRSASALAAAAAGETEAGSATAAEATEPEPEAAPAEPSAESAQAPEPAASTPEPVAVNAPDAPNAPAQPSDPPSVDHG